MPLVTVADADLKSAFPIKPFPVRHALAEEPLLALPALAALAAALPGDRVEYNAGDCLPDQRPEDVRAVAMEPAEIVERIETANAWLVLKRVESDPRYRAIAASIYRAASHVVGSRGIGRGPPADGSDHHDRRGVSRSA